MELQEIKKALAGLNKKDLTSLIVENQKEIVGLKEDLKTWDQITDSDNWNDMREVAKLLNEKDKKYKVYGRNTIFAILRDCKILMSNNEPYQSSIDRGYFKIIAVPKDLGYNTVTFNKTMISPKGIDFIRRILDGHIDNYL